MHFAIFGGHSFCVIARRKQEKTEWKKKRRKKLYGNLLRQMENVEIGARAFFFSLPLL